MDRHDAWVTQFSASLRASCRNRSPSACDIADPACSTLMATGRSSWVSWPRYTGAEPARSQAAADLVASESGRRDYGLGQRHGSGGRATDREARREGPRSVGTPLRGRLHYRLGFGDTRPPFARRSYLPLFQLGDLGVQQPVDGVLGLLDWGHWYSIERCGDAKGIGEALRPDRRLNHQPGRVGKHFRPYYQLRPVASVVGAWLGNWRLAGSCRPFARAANSGARFGRIGEWH